MSSNYSAILWNKQKRSYDTILWIGIGLFLSSFIGFQLLLRPTITLETVIIRATALVAIVLLHIILIIGPLSRLDKRFLPLLYNRRHLGVSMFFIAAIHGAFSIIQFHALGDTNPILSVFISNEHYRSISMFPFQVLGFIALFIFLMMAVTSHDFWLKTLSPSIWKSLHMGIYLAYGLVLLHVATGALQYETHPVYWFLLFGGFVSIAGIHLVAGFEHLRRKKQGEGLMEDGFRKLHAVDKFDEGRGKSFVINGENIAIFRYEDKFSAISNICKHQMGPLAEGRIVEGCVTCPWHGYQYIPRNGQSPPPFTEKLKTYSVKVQNGYVFVKPKPNPEGTDVEPAYLNYGK